VRDVTNVADLDEDEVVERRGASGARIIIGKKYTTKLDVERTGDFVRSQGEWLSRYPKVTLLPRVTHVLANGYIMETLTVPPLPMDVAPVLQHILAELRTQLWVLATSGHAWDLPTHRNYVVNLIRDVGLERAQRVVLEDNMRAFAETIFFEVLQRGQTHGDCIVDNVAYREREGSTTGALDLVLLDPIPQTYALPPLRAVDVGRLIQSAIGYENMRYTRSRAPRLDIDDLVTAVLNWYMPTEFKVNEARACLYFAIIHMLRGIRTTLLDTATRLALWYLTNELIKVTKEWMR
jgi:hypothetical protein